MRASIYLLIGLAACGRATATDGIRAALSPDRDAAASSVDVQALGPRMLTSLTAREARAVCEAAAQRMDLCMQQAFFGPANPRGCDAQLAACRDLTAPAVLDCSLAHFDLGDECTATVTDYLACVQDTYEGLSCELVGQSLEVRANCLPLLRSCRTLASEFGDPDTYVEPCDTATAPERVDDDDDIRGLDACPRLPARFVVLGDSIAACFLSSDVCAPDIIAEDLRQRYVADLDYQNDAVSNSRTMDWMTQAERVTPGPGHLWIWIYLGGNDLLACTGLAPTQILDCVDAAIASAHDQWQELFAYFSDSDHFPDGATFLLNTQYSLQDQCRMPAPSIGGAALDAKLMQYNDTLFILPAIERPDTITIDQLPDWLGHARNANKSGCPYCSRDDNERWLQGDGIHPNALGHRHIAHKWQVTIDAMYESCKPSVPHG